MSSRVPFTSLPLDQTDVTYVHGPDSSPRPGVTPGRTTRLELGTRSIWVHVPAGVQPTDELACTVFQDGGGFLDPDDDLRAAVVLDNLVHAGDIPPMVGVFVDPAADRNAEYDPFDGRYADVLVSEVLPRVRDVVRLSDDPRRHALCGFSSGASASFTAAWHRPDVFGKVIGFSSSFPQVRGGRPVSQLIALHEVRPLRVFLQVGHRDLGWDDPEDNWLAENLRVAAALAEAAYDVRLVLGDGGHDSNHAGVLLPDALRWSWRDDPATPELVRP